MISQNKKKKFSKK